MTTATIYIEDTPDMWPPRHPNGKENVTYPYLKEFLKGIEDLCEKYQIDVHSMDLLPLNGWFKDPLDEFSWNGTYIYPEGDRQRPYFKNMLRFNYCGDGGG